MTARVGDLYGTTDADRCPDCGHHPGCTCTCCPDDWTEETPMTTTARTSFVDLLTSHYGQPLPESYDTWGWKVVRPDLRTYQGYRWPWPGNTVTDPAARRSSDPCPGSDGGFCVALDWDGARAGGHGGVSVLLLAYRQADVLARDAHKLRVREAFVADLVDVHRLVREKGARADLTDADLTGAYLTGAYLTGANLTRANLARAYLTGADLTGADLARAYLTGANLTGADLTGAYLADAYLAGAYLTGAYLTRANLTDANLTGAYLTGAYLTGAYLAHADLTRANLARANLTGADLTGAYLTGANLADADLAHANLARANLTGANLTRANLTGANLTDANLARANLTGAKNLDKAIGYQAVPSGV